MIPELDTLRIMLVVMTLGTLAIGFMPGPCRCEKCAFHTNERRMENLRRAEAAAKYAADQSSLRHDYEHKGGGFLPGDPDKFNCSVEGCPRNRKVH